MEELTPFHQRKDLQGGVYGELPGIHTTFLEGFRIRISQKSIPCLISKNFSVVKINWNTFLGRMIFEMMDITNSSQENEK